MLDSRLMLKATGIHITLPRRAILNLFIESDEALSVSCIEQRIQVDRSTIYRTLQTFIQFGIVRKVPAASHQPTYVLRETLLAKNDKTDKEVYFQCNQCSKTYSIEEMDISYGKLPKGFVYSHAIVNVMGVCETCQSDRTYYRSAS